MVTNSEKNHAISASGRLNRLEQFKQQVLCGLCTSVARILYRFNSQHSTKTP